MALYLDEGLAPERVANLEEAVKRTVGFDSQRDVFTSAVLPFFAVEGDEEESESDAAAAAPVEEPNPMMEKLLERGVEIVVAIAFLILLMKSLRAAKSAPPTVEPQPAEAEPGRRPGASGTRPARGALAIRSRARGRNPGLLGPR